jgi:hypothetical protein
VLPAVFLSDFMPLTGIKVGFRRRDLSAKGCLPYEIQIKSIKENVSEKSKIKLRILTSAGQGKSPNPAGKGVGETSAYSTG